MKKSKQQDPEPNPLDHPFWKKFLEENGPIWIPFRIDLSDAVASDAEARETRRPLPRPSNDQLRERVSDAQATIIFDGGNPRRPPTKRQHIDKMSYAYGLLWGVACALDCSLREVLQRHGSNEARRDG